MAKKYIPAFSTDILLYICLILFTTPCVLSAIVPGGINLLNDSAFPLTAVIQGADGTFLGQARFKPGEQLSWATNFDPTKFHSPSAPNVSMTPYTVVWKCTNGGFYSTCSGVSPGSLVRANACEGVYYCKPPPKKNKNQQGEEQDSSSDSEDD